MRSVDKKGQKKFRDTIGTTGKTSLGIPAFLMYHSVTVDRLSNGPPWVCFEAV